MTPEPRPGLLDIKPYRGGVSDAPGFEAPIKLSSNENCFGCSAAAKDAMANCAEQIERYPDGGVHRLRAALADKHDLDAERIVCGCGSDELLQLLGKAYLRDGDEVLLAQNGFLSYKLIALQNGAVPVAAPETEDLRIDAAAFLSKVTKRTRIVFLANPNNPTGYLMPGEEVRKLQAGLPENVLLVIDGAYAEFVKDEDYEGGFALVESCKNVVATRTFSKSYGLAGLRVGWAYCPKEVAAVLNRVRSPFNVNAMAQAAALAALDDTDFLQKSVDHVAHWAPKIEAEVKKLGLKAYPSAGNFVLIGLGSPEEADALEKFLVQRGLILRGMRGFGLPGFIRMTIGTDADNQAVLAALADFAAQ
ncbi:MAG: histidinol-phosphate transaminase [Robiginitomaculum sp.]|nr:MAG: histidinol-phosphate transaminase [Robiginitomaculum sp.]